MPTRGSRRLHGKMADRLGVGIFVDLDAGLDELYVDRWAMLVVLIYDIWPDFGRTL